MGFFNRFFKSKEPEKEEVLVSGASSWFDKKISNRLGNVNEELKQLFSNIEKEKLLFNKNLQQLKDAKLKNPNIPIRVVHAMQGNRDAYMKKAFLFSNSINIPELDYTKISAFCSNFSNLLEDFSQSSAKSYYILKEFLSNEVSLVAKNIKSLDDSIKKIKDLFENEKDGILFTQGLKDDIKKLEKMIRIKQQIKDQIEMEKERKISTVSFIKKLETKINTLKQSRDFSEFDSMNEELSETNKEIKKLESEITNLFAPLEKAMRKYAKIAVDDEKLIVDYHNAAISSLIQDEELKIINILDNIERNIGNGEIELEEKKKKKVLSIIEKINKDLLVELKTRYKNLEERKKTLQEQINRNTVSREIADLNYKIEHTQQQLSVVEDRIEEFDKKHEKVDIEGMKKELEEKLGIATSTSVILKL